MGNQQFCYASYKDRGNDIYEVSKGQHVVIEYNTKTGIEIPQEIDSKTKDLLETVWSNLKYGLNGATKIPEEPRESFAKAIEELLR